MYKSKLVQQKRRRMLPFHNNSRTGGAIVEAPAQSVAPVTHCYCFRTSKETESKKNCKKDASQL